MDFHYAKSIPKDLVSKHETNKHHDTYFFTQQRLKCAASITRVVKGFQFQYTDTQNEKLFTSIDKLSRFNT